MPQPYKNKLKPLEIELESIGKRLCKLRKQRGYTQAELAEKIGVPEKTASTWIKNANEII